MSIAGNPLVSALARAMTQRRKPAEDESAPRPALRRRPVPPVGVPVDEAAYSSPRPNVGYGAQDRLTGGTSVQSYAADPLAEEAVRESVARSVLEQRQVGLDEASRALRMRRAELADMQRRGVRGPDVAAAYADIESLGRAARKSQERLAEVRALTAPSALDQPPERFNAAQDRLLGEYRMSGLPVAGEFTGPLQAGREFFRPRNYSDPDVMAAREDLNRRRAKTLASPEYGLESDIGREGIDMRRAMFNRGVAGRTAYETETGAIPQLATGDVTNSLREQQLRKHQLGRDIIQTQVDTPSLSEAEAIRVGRNVSAASQLAGVRAKGASDLEAEAQNLARFDPAGFDDSMSRYLTELQSAVPDMDSQQAEDFFSEFGDAITPLERFAQLYPDKAAEAARKYANTLARLRPGRSLTDKIVSMGRPGSVGPRTAIKMRKYDEIKKRLDSIAKGKENAAG